MFCTLANAGHYWPWKENALIDVFHASLSLETPKQAGLPTVSHLDKVPAACLYAETSKSLSWVSTPWKEVEHIVKQCDFLEAKFSMCIDSIIHLSLLPNGFFRSWQAVRIQSRSTCYVKTVVLETFQRKIQLPSRLSWKMVIFVLNNCICLNKLSFLKLG